MITSNTTAATVTPAIRPFETEPSPLDDDSSNDCNQELSVKSKVLMSL
jgi:hypothetical protein